jgi:hypothetical protein
MNVLLPALYKNAEYIIEYNEPNSTPDHKDYIFCIQSIKSQTDQNRPKNGKPATVAGSM